MNIIGHKKILHRLERSISQCSVSHAYFFSGPEHVGKFTVALNFARNLIENRMEWVRGIDVSLEMLRFDIRVVAPETEEKNGVVKKKDIKVEAIKDLQHWLSLSARGSCKAAIVDSADWLNKTAQNALLKTLEEMPEKAVIILVAADERKILPTVISRCQLFKFGTVPPSELREWVKGEGADEEKAGEIMFWSLGMPGLAVKLLRDPAELEMRKEALRKIKEMLHTDMVKKLSFAEELSKDENAAADTLHYWAVLFREIVRGSNQSLNISSRKAFLILEKIVESLEVIRGTNANTRLVLENLFLYL